VITYAQAEGFWIAADGPSGVASIMAAIAEAESSLNPSAIQQGQPYATTGWGLWQITPGNSVPSVGIDGALLDPLTNARAALVKYRGQGLKAWTTYTSGRYKQYLQVSAPEPPTQPTPPPSPVPTVYLSDLATEVPMSMFESDNAAAVYMVTSWYGTYLHRAPDTAGLDYWVYQVVTTKDPAPLLADFLASPEAQAANK
jgi:hypothetical protein